MAQDSQFGVLLVTGGRTHQEMYGPGFAADSRCRLVGLTDEAGLDENRQQWNRELADQLGIPYLEDFSAALHRDDVDVVCVCCEPERRARVSTLVAQAGKHLYSDKPLGGNLKDVRTLAAEVSAAGIKSQMFTLMQSPWSQRAVDLVNSGELGTLQAIHMDLLFAKGPSGTLPAYQPRKESYPPTRFTFVDSKREVFTTAIYSLAFLTRLTGKRFKRVQATTANYFFAEHLHNNVEDFGALLLEMEEGLQATVTAGRIGWTSHPHGGPMQVMLVGTKKTVFVDAYRPRLEVSSDEQVWLAPRRNPDDPMGFWNSTQANAGVKPKREWQLFTPEGMKSDQSHFIDCLETDKDSDMNVALAAHATETVFAAYQSAATAQAVAPDQATCS